ncbi:MAG: hypothetical protein ACRDA3_10255 [Peptostreptococcaceae bacterium]
MKKIVIVVMYILSILLIVGCSNNLTNPVLEGFYQSDMKSGNCVQFSFELNENTLSEQLGEDKAIKLKNLDKTPTYFEQGINDKNNQKTIWNMEYIQDKGGDVIYCSNENKDIYPNADIKTIECILQQSSIIIIDKDTENEWIGHYRMINEDKKTELYEVTFDNKEIGHMVKSFTEYMDKTYQDTLIISCGEYSINLTIKEGKI